jgi:hypothetical protein
VRKTKDNTEKRLLAKYKIKDLHGKPKVFKTGQGKTAAIAKYMMALGKDEALIVRKKDDGVEIGTIKTRLRVSEIKKVVAEQHLHAEPSGKGELSEDEKKALVAAGFDLTPLAPDLEDPVAVAAAEYAKLREESLATTEAARLLDVEDSRIRQRLSGKAPTLYGLKVDGDWRIPKFQFEGNARVPGIEKVIPHLRAGLNPVSVVRWFNTPNPDLRPDEDEERSLSPLDWLKTGHDPSVVAELAADL